MISQEWLQMQAKHLASPALLKHKDFDAFISGLSQASPPARTPVSQEERYWSVLEKSSDIVYVTDSEGFFTFVNPVAQEITGYTREELLGMRYLDLIDETYRSRAKKFYEIQVARNNSSTYFEFPIMSRNKGRRWIGQSVQLSATQSGELELIALAIDITRKKEEEENLKEANRQLMLLRELMNGSTESILVVNENGRIFYLNKQAALSYGLDISAEKPGFIGEIENSYATQSDWDKHVGELKTKVSAAYESSFVDRVTGIHFPIEISEKYVKIGDAGFIIVLWRDVSARKKTEEIRSAQEEKYRNIITNMNLGLLEVNSEGLIQFANQSFLNMSGYDFPSMNGKDAASLFASGNEVEKVREHGEMRKKGTSDMYEVQVKNKSGDTRWWMISGAPNYNEKGEMIGSIGIHLDVTDQKKLSTELETAMRRAEEASRAKETFLANMSHEIRTPLNGIIGMIRDLQHEDLQPRQLKYVNNAAVASQHLLSVLNNVLDMSRIEAGQLELEHRPFSLADTLRDVKRMMNSSARAKSLFLGMSRVNIEGHTYLGDAFRIRQVLLNLVGNAIKFTETGGVFVDCKVKESRKNEHVVSIVVEDTGVGMEKEFQANLFNKFSQEDASISRRYGGSGLGMAISSELISIMKGDISVCSAKSEGTIITITLTLPLAEIKPENAPSKKTNADLKGMRVLLVEDNDFNLAVASRSLKRFGCVVTEARNGQEAVDRVKAGENFDAVLMDMQMPVLDGISATRIIREELKNDVPVIALTANAFKAEIDACRAVGMNDYITKPYQEEVMREVLTLYKNASEVIDTVESPAEEILMYDLSSLNEISGGDEGFVKEMIVLFNRQVAIAVAELTNGLAANDKKTISATAHRMKASIDNLGIRSLRQPIRDLEKNASDESCDHSQVAALVTEVVGLMEQTAEQLKRKEL